MKTCTRAGCDKPHRAHGLCSTHYEYERGPRHRHREDRVLATRARNRAVAALIKAHADEFRVLYETAFAEACEEAAKIRVVAEAHGAEPTNDRQVIRLRRGPKRAEEEPEDRAEFVRPVRCGQCSAYHEAGHKCLACAARNSRANTPGQTAEERIRAALAAGKSAQWIADSGEPRALIVAVMRAIRAERQEATV